MCSAVILVICFVVLPLEPFSRQISDLEKMCLETVEAPAYTLEGNYESEGEGIKVKLWGAASCAAVGVDIQYLKNVGSTNPKQLFCL